MRTDRGWSRFYATGWLLSVGIGVLEFRQWRLHVREVEQRAEEAERTREEVARRRALEERLRIARDLHDSLTHSISVVKVQAGVAAHLARKYGEEPSAALVAIQEAAGDAARELRSTLDVLRREDASNGRELGHLQVLVDRAREAGVSATLTVEGCRRELPNAVEQAAYRVVQEALTNVGRHAGSVRASVTLVYRTAELTVRVEDDGAALQDDPVPGHGLIGMRERVTALDGRLQVGPRASRGFSVVAEFPLTEPS